MRTTPIPISFDGHQRTIAQKTILRLLYDRGEDFLLVSGVYAGDVLALQCEGLITSKPTGEGQLEVRVKVGAA